MEIDVELLEKIWNLELFSSGNQTIRFNQIIVAIIFVIVGVLFASKLSYIVKDKLGKSKKFEEHIIFFIQKMMFNILLVIIILLALPIAGIPITIFTLLGGAFALGIGLGAQNFFNNLISFMIILFEKPIKIGDIVEIAGEEGRVEDISNRRVRIRRTDGIDLLIPNSHFLEKPVINWTLSDKLVMGEIKVGVSYDSDVELVKKSIFEVVASNDKVDKNQKPVVLFEDFGSSTLNFNLLFYTNASNPIKFREIKSEIRFGIKKKFGEEGIKFAYPQLDVRIKENV